MKCLIQKKAGINLEFKEMTAEIVKNGTPNFPLILSQGTQISILKKEKGPQFLATIIGLLITDFQRSFNLIRPLNDEQIAIISIELMTEYWGYRFEDFIAFFQLAKKGIYGNILDRLDANTILKMLLVYDTQRVDELRATQTSQQEVKGNLSPYVRGDRDKQNEWFDDKGAQIGDFVRRVSNIKNKDE